MAKKVIVEFDVDDSLTVIDLCEVVHDAMKKARFEIDEKFDRIGTGRGSGFYYTPEETDDHKRWDYVCTITPEAINTPPLAIVNHIIRWRKGER